MTHLRIKSCGAMTSLQDLGRIGHQRYGVSPAGAMDRPALVIANALVGNAPGVGRDIRVVRTGFKLNGEAPAVNAAPPRLGEHSAQILAELDYAADEIASMKAERVI